MKISVAIGQVKSRLFDLESNIARHIELIKKAKQKSVDLIVFSELSLTGYYLREAIQSVAVPLDDPLLDSLAEAADGISVIAGLVELSDDNRLFNTAVYFENRIIAGYHRKIFLPDYGMFEEGRYFAAGGELEVFEAAWGKFGILICEDAWHPRLALELAEQNVSLIVNMSASPVKGTSKETGISNKQINYDNCKFYSRSFGIPVLFANKIGYEQGVRFWGGSAVFAPDGEIISEASINDEELCVAEIDFGMIRRAQAGFPYIRDERMREPVNIKVNNV